MRKKGGRNMINEERRRHRRMELSSSLLIKGLNGTEENVQIEVVNISKSGIGFICEMELNADIIYEAFLTIWMKENIHAFIQIVRTEKVEENIYKYGAVFIGMSEMDSFRIEVFDTMENFG
ncbi:PilZ domain-containing protein [Lachnospiraceae bacterium]|jgi:hypothetical protein|nr:PilZ domain-containing protein [Lachnospiraceae bacterium]